MSEFFWSLAAFCFVAYAAFTALTDQSMSRYILDSELYYV